MRRRVAAVPAGQAGSGAGAFGIDISLNGTGICLVSGNPRKTVNSGLVADSALLSIGTVLRGPERLDVLSRAVMSWMIARGFGAGSLVVTEGYAYSSTHAHSTGEIGGCIRALIWRAGGNLVVVPPTTLKKFLTGRGKGDKNVVMKHVFKRWLFDVDEDNQCDSFGCAVLGLVDQLPFTERTGYEAQLLKEKVERYAGKAQVRWHPEELKPASKRSGRVKLSG